MSRAVHHRHKKGEFRPVRRPGAATRKAKREGLTLREWEEKHKNDPGRTGRQARFPLIAAHWSHKRGHKRKTHKREERREHR